MKLEQSFEVTASAEEIASRIVTFMERNGYQRSPVAAMAFTRGSRIGSYFSFSPRKWQTHVTIARTQVNPMHWSVTLHFDINDDGQLVTQHERSYWKAELDNLQRVIQTGDLTAEALSQQERLLVSSGARGFAIFLSVGLFVAIPTGLVIEFFSPLFAQWSTVAGVLAGITAGLFAAKRHWGF
jgi:hypothetical protein